MLLPGDFADTRCAKVVEQEINVWRRLHHPHIVQFFGACSISDPPFMVCALKANGNINEYLAKSPRANRCKLVSTSYLRVRARLLMSNTKLHEASLGLVYLHQQGVVHGDLKGVRDPLESSSFFADTLTQE